MARGGRAAGVAGLYPGPAAPGVRDEPPAPFRQRLVAARLRRADGAERGRRGADADHGAGRPDRLGAQPRVPPRAADERPGPGDVRAVTRPRALIRRTWWDTRLRSQPIWAASTVIGIRPPSATLSAVSTS